MGRPETQVKGMQEGAGVAAAVKHFAFNDQARLVMDIDSDSDKARQSKKKPNSISMGNMHCADMQRHRCGRHKGRTATSVVT